jgi:hypothetical protein
MNWQLLNWKTLLGGLIAGLPAIINFITPVIPIEYQGLAVGFGALIIGLFAKDKNVTGGTVAATPEATKRVESNVPQVKVEAKRSHHKKEA